jgi:hypothetical protein
MSLVELLVGPSGAYLLILSGFFGVVLLVASAARGKFKAILASFAVSVVGGILSVYTGAGIFVLVTLLGFCVMFALGLRQLVHERTNLLLVGVFLEGVALALFFFRPIMANFFEL